MNYEESAQLMNDPVFRSRIKVAALDYANNILAQSPTPPASNLRWAANVFQSPDQWAATLSNPVVMDPTIQTVGASASDLQILGAVQAVANKLI